MGLRNGRLAFALSAMAVLSSAGCMQERPAINRVQPNFVDKNDFIPVEYAELTTTGHTPSELTPRMLAREPVFYTQTTIIAKPTHGGFTGMTQYSAADKIRWEVTENFLLARQAWEYVHGAPIGADGIARNVQNSGDVVAAYRIESHFDIRREYNSTTGEEMNVIDENQSDRPWYQRRYMRIDWSQNLIDGYGSPFEYEQWSGRIQSEPVPVFINNPQDPNAPVFEYNQHGTNRSLDYFDVVNRAVFHPETTAITFGNGESYPAIPACFFDEPADCAPAEVTMRVAFRRMDPNRDYEPALVSNPLPNIQNPPAYLDMERFGFFDQSRIGYDHRNPSILDTQRVHWASRHNLWMWHHALFTNTDTAASGPGCNFDRDCTGDNMTCRIGNAAFDATHRGQCQAMIIHHTADDANYSCQSSDDCVQTYNGQGISPTAICDTGTHTCGEHFVRCSDNNECTSTVDPNSYCDLASAYNRADNRGLCTMPFRQRQVRQVAYHETQNYPGYMQGVTEAIVADWNRAFANAVQTARVRECQIQHGAASGAPVDGADACDTPAVRGTDATLGDAWQGGGDGTFPYVGCHTPVWGTDAGPGQHTQAEVDAAHAAGWDLGVCGVQGTITRLGDLRYSQIGAITEHDAQGYWGLANIASDPETGEMVIGRGAVWQTITDLYAGVLTDTVRLLNGDLTPEEYSQGDNFVQSMRQLGTGHSASDQIMDAPFRQPNSLQQLGQSHSSFEHLVRPDAGWFTAASGRTMLGSRTDRENSALAIGHSRIREAGFLGDGTQQGTQRLMALRNSALESRMMTDQQVRLAPTASEPTSGAITEEILNHASPLRGQSMQIQRMRADINRQLSEWQCNFEADAAFTDDMVMGLANRITSGDQITCATDPHNCYGRTWDFRPGGQIDYDLVRQYAANFIHQGVLAHEIGHSLGQRHNFTASADAINYFDDYWRLRGQGHPNNAIRPRYEYLADPADGHYYSDAEINGRIDEFSYSSVMDYKGFNEDAHGLGRYDFAFIANGYTNLVQAFRSVSNMNLAQQYYTATAGAGFSTPIDLTSWQSGILHGLHYTQIPAIFGTRADGTPNIGDDNRYWVFLNETSISAVTGWGDPAFSNMTNDGAHMLVPYRFDTDNRAGLVWQDQRYDSGADAFESLHYVQEHILNYYFQNSYGRYRSGFSTTKYVNRMRSRYLEQTHQTNQLLAFELLNYADFFNTFRGWDAFLHDPNEHGGVVNYAAMAMTADTMANLLTMPEMGTHNPAVQPDGTTLVAQNQATTAGFDIPINLGRAFESNWRNEAGFWWYEQLNRAGAYYDKVLSVQVITDPELALLGRDTPNDIRQFSLSQYTIYPGQMIRFMGGLLAEDYQDYAPIVETGGAHNIVRPHLATLNLPAPMNGRRIDATHLPLDPQDHFTVQLVAAVHTIAQFPTSYDQRYMDYCRLWMDGSIESIQVEDPATNTVAFQDPWTHQTYRALHIGAGAGEGGADVGASTLVHPATRAPANEAGIAARMLLHVTDLDYQRQNAATPAARTAAEQAEHKYLDLLNVMRELTRWFGSGYARLPENG